MSHGSTVIGGAVRLMAPVCLFLQPPPAFLNVQGIRHSDDLLLSLRIGEGADIDFVCDLF